MGRDFWFYQVTCEHCGNTGRITIVQDDWMRSDVSECEGFFGRIHFLDPQPECLTCEDCGKRGDIKIEYSLKPFEVAS